MRFYLEIDTSGAAFEADPLELQRVIKNVANRVMRAQESMTDDAPGASADGFAVDANGNQCGSWKLRNWE